jgi:hypothetical protein
MKSTLGQFYFCFTTKDDPKEEGSRKRKGNLLIPKNPEAYTFTKDPAKQKQHADAAAKFIKEFTAACKKAATDKFGSTKGVNWNRVTDGDVDEKRPGYWEIRAKSQFAPQMVGPAGEPISEDEAESKFKNGNWGKIYFKEPAAFSGGGKNKSTSVLLDAIQFGYEGTMPAGGGGNTVVEFDALEEQEIQDGDFDTDDEDDLDDLE